MCREVSKEVKADSWRMSYSNRKGKKGGGGEKGEWYKRYTERQKARPVYLLYLPLLTLVERKR